MTKVGERLRPVVHSSLEGAIFERAPRWSAYRPDQVRQNINDLLRGITDSADLGEILAARSSLRRASIRHNLTNSGVFEYYEPDALTFGPLMRTESAKLASEIIERMHTDRGSAIGILHDDPEALLRKLFEMCEQGVIPQDYLRMELLIVGVTSARADAVIDHTIDSLYIPYLTSSLTIGQRVKLLIPKSPDRPIVTLYPIPEDLPLERGRNFGQYLLRRTQSSYLAA